MTPATIFDKRSTLRAWRKEFPDLATQIMLGDSATIGKYPIETLDNFLLTIGIEATPAQPVQLVQPENESPAQLIARAMAAMASATPSAPLDLDTVRRVAREEISNAPQVAKMTTVEIVNLDKSITKREGEHYLFPLVIKLVSAGIPTMLCGPAGSGKTTLAHNVATTLGKEFEFNSYGPGMSESKLLGYKDATGNYHSTALTRQVKAGGVYLADELDRADGAIVTTLNSILANGQISTPEGCYSKNDNFVFIAGTNTAGTGADSLYTAAQEQDAALLDRLFFLHMPYDAALEERACGLSITPQKQIDIASGGIPTAEKWLAAVRASRATCESRQMRHTISPRAAIMGCALARHGVGADWLIPGLLTRGLPADESQAIETAAREELN